MSRVQLINELLSKADSEFRGGDPEEIRLKKEEKELDLGKAVKKTQHAPSGEKEMRQALQRQRRRAERGQFKNPTSRSKGKGARKPSVAARKAMDELCAKADPGSEAGAFRGGDPEEIRIKREEHLQELEDSGTLEDQEEGEEITQEEIEEAEQEDKERKEDQGKSLVSKASQILTQDMLHIAGGNQISPVDTMEDYRARDANGDPLDRKYAKREGMQPQPYFEPAPIRPGKNQHRDWSDVIGIKVPLTGDPIQYLRRFMGQGKIGEMEKEAPKIVKAFSGETGLLWRYSPEYHAGRVLSKGVGDAPAPGPHKYISREWVNGRWEYEYRDDPHPDHHGVAHLNHAGGHTLEVHPSYEEHDDNPTPEGAYNHALHMHAVEGGSHPVTIWDKDHRPQKKVLHMPGGKKDEEGNYATDEKGVPIAGPMFLRDPGEEKGGKKIANMTALHKKLSPVTTERDANGDPWMHWRMTTPSKGGQPRVKRMYDSRSTLNQDREDADQWKTPGQRTTVDSVRREAERVIGAHKRSKAQDEKEHDGFIPEEARSVAHTWEPTHHHVFEPHPETGMLTKQIGEDGKAVTKERETSHAIERGEIGTHAMELRKWSSPLGDTVRTVVKHVPVRKFKDIHERNDVHHKLMMEHYAELRNMATSALKKVGLLTGDPQQDDRQKMSLIVDAMGAVTDNAINNYDPNNEKGARFSTYFLSNARNAMWDALPEHTSGTDAEYFSARRKASKEGKAVELAPGTVVQPSAQKQKQVAEQEEQQLTAQPKAGYGRGYTDESAAGVMGHERFRSAEETARLQGEEPAPKTRAEERESRMAPEQEDEKPFHVKQREHDALEMFQQNYSPEQQKQVLEQLETSRDFKNRIFEQTPEMEYVYRVMRGIQEPHSIAQKSWNWLPAVEEIIEACEIIRKAAEEAAMGDDPSMKYLWREGEPGTHKYMWEDPQGNVVRGTNAPPGHEHHDEAAGPPQIHPHEPTPETAPSMFDNFGRKMHRAAPEEAEVETNHHYDPDVNHWAHKYSDPETGQDEFIGLHRDRVKNHRYALNEDLRLVDTQLEALRSFYSQLLQQEDLRAKATGMVLALADQARALADGDDSGLLSMRVGDISVSGNTYKLSYKDREGNPHTVSVVLDSPALAVLGELARGKKNTDLLFEVEGQPLAQAEIAQILDEKLGLALRQIQVYHGTELFSKEFQRLVSQAKNLEPKDLPKIADQAYGRVMRMLGHKRVDAETARKRFVDPIAVEALFMSAVHHHDPEVNKSIEKAYKLHGKMIFQGLPVSIENRKGSVRKWYDPHEKREGTTKMHHAYGYIRGTKGIDGDHVDVYIGPDKNADKVFVVHQNKAPDFKEFDEDKCMLGFSSGADAKAAYLKQYDKPGFFGGMTAMSMEEFKDKVLGTKHHPQMIKSSKGWMCSVCSKGWGECSHAKDVEKSFKGSFDTGPIVWHVTVSPHERTPDEKMFGDWIHTHPMHEHDRHWGEFKHATKVEDLPPPQVDREYAHGGNEPPVVDEDAGGLEDEEPPEPEEEAAPEEDAPSIAPPDTLKSILDSMIQMVA